MTLTELVLKEPKPIITAEKKDYLPHGEAEKIERIIGNMSNLEKAVAVRKIPTEILQNEITRRVKRDKENLRCIKEVIDSMEEY